MSITASAGGNTKPSRMPQRHDTTTLATLVTHIATTLVSLVTTPVVTPIAVRPVLATMEIVILHRALQNTHQGRNQIGAGGNIFATCLNVSIYLEAGP